MKPKIGLAEMAERGTISATSEVLLVMLVGARDTVGVEDRKTAPAGRPRVGRRVGKDAKVL